MFLLKQFDAAHKQAFIVLCKVCKDKYYHQQAEKLNLGGTNAALCSSVPSMLSSGTVPSHAQQLPDPAWDQLGVQDVCYCSSCLSTPNSWRCSIPHSSGAQGTGLQPALSKITRLDQLLGTGSTTAGTAQLRKGLCLKAVRPGTWILVKHSWALVKQLPRISINRRLEKINPTGESKISDLVSMDK